MFNNRIEKLERRVETLSGEIYNLQLILDSKTSIEGKFSPKYNNLGPNCSVGFSYGPSYKTNVKAVIEILLDHLGLELDKTEEKQSNIVLKNKATTE